MKYGYVGIIGPTNAGKSSLFNNICNSGLSAVSHKINTTTEDIRTVVSFENGKAIILDTPGTFDVNIKSLMDCAILVHDARRPVPEHVELFCPTVLCINKIDLIKYKDQLLVIADKFNNICDLASTFFISNKLNDGIKDLNKCIFNMLPEYNASFDVKQTYSNSDLIFNVLKELIYKHVHDEIPYIVKIEKIIFGDNYQRAVISSPHKRHKSIFTHKLLRYLEYKTNTVIKARFGLDIKMHISFKHKKS